jgi:uncharacterized protein YbaP (TraB family)
MQKRLGASLLVVLSACSAGGAASGHPSNDLDVDPGATKSAATEHTTPFLWRIEGETPSYLFGTVHVGVSGITEMPAAVWTALDASSTVVLEADLGAIDAAELARRGQLPPGGNLEALLGAAAWGEAERLLGDNSENIRQLEPWLAQSQLLFALFPTDLPLDAAVLRRARRGHKALQYFEEVGEQLELMEEETDAAQLRALLDPNSDSRRHLHQLIDAYRRGDANLLTDITFSPADVRENRDHFERMFFARNQRWTEALVPHLGSGGLFVAVGVGHLLGEKGLPALLRERGFEVTRLIHRSIPH